MVKFIKQVEHNQHLKDVGIETTEDRSTSGSAMWSKMNYWIPTALILGVWGQKILGFSDLILVVVTCMLFIGIAIHWLLNSDRNLDNKPLFPVKKEDTMEVVSKASIEEVDLNGQINYSNQQLASVLSYTKPIKNENDLLLAIMESAKYPSEIAKTFQNIKQGLVSESSGEIELKDNRVLRYTTKPKLDSNIKGGRIWSFDDITNFNQLQAKLKHKEALYNALLDSGLFGVLILDNEERFVTGNEYFASTLGYDLSEIETIDLAKLLSEEIESFHEEYKALRINQKETISFKSHEYIRKDGTKVLADTTIKAIRDEKGSLMQICCIIKPLGKSVVTRMSLDDSVFKHIFDKIAYPCLLFGDNTILEANEAATDTFGGQLLKMNIGGLMPVLQNEQDLSMPLFNRMQEEARQQPCHSFEWIVNTAKKGRRQALFTLVFHRWGEKELFFAVIQDFTEVNLQKSIEKAANEVKSEKTVLEEELKVNKEKLSFLEHRLSRRTNDLHQFASIAANDIEEPLRMIGHMMSNLKQKYANVFERECLSVINSTNDGVRKMSSLLTNLMEFARVETNKAQFVTADLNEVVSNKMLDLYRRIVEQKASIDMHLLPEELICIPEQIGALFYNLIYNGIKFNESERPRVIIDKKEREKDWLFSIRDNGIGMSESLADALFDFSTDSNTVSATVGLPMCKRIVELHGGEIWYESQEGKGTTFYFTISKQIESVK